MKVKKIRINRKLKFYIISAAFVIVGLSLAFYLVLERDFEGSKTSEIAKLKPGAEPSNLTKPTIKASEEGFDSGATASKVSNVKPGTISPVPTKPPVKVSEGDLNGAKTSKIADLRPTVKPLDLSRPPTIEELMAAGQLGGLLYPTYDISSQDLSKTPLKATNIQSVTKRIEDMNLSFGKAIQEWNKHEYKKATEMFKEYVEEYPDSPWVSEAILHIGCDANYNGRYSEAEECFSQIIESNNDNDYVGAKMLENKARLRLGVLKVLQNNFDEAMRHFSDLKIESLSWRDRTYASHWIQRISRYEADKVAMLKCGVQALAYVLKKDGRESEAQEVIEMLPSSQKGHSIQDLRSIAAGYGYNLTGLRISTSELKDVPLPAIVQINGRSEGDSGHYLVLEKSSDEDIFLFDSQSGRRFHQSPEGFSREWGGNVLVFSDKANLPGVRLSEIEIGQIYGGCCGVPRPEDDLGDPDPDGEDGCGAPTWRVNPVNMNLFVRDTPLWHSSPVGPSVGISLSYNSQSTIAYNEPFGNKWQFNYASYLVVDTGGNVTIFMPDGRRDTFMPDGSGGYNNPYQVYNQLIKTAANRFELKFPDDTVYVYDIPAGTGSLQPFLIDIRDAHGQRLAFGYNSNVELTSITDAMGRVTALTYNTDGLVTSVEDPFGRSATFEYDASRNLTKITDMGGYWSSFSYDVDVYLTGIEDSRGRWEFYIEPADGIPANSDNYPPPGDTMWENYRITVTNPRSEKEEYFYYGGCDDFTCDGYTWYVSPRDYITWQSEEVNNFRINTPKTRYFFTASSSGQRREISKILYPEGGSAEYGYDSDGNRTSVTDSHGHPTSYTYNDIGRITSVTDAKGNVTNMAYAANGVDLLNVQNGLGTITMTHNGTHDLTSITDRLGNKAAFIYNSFGQMTSRTDAKDALDIITNYTYDSDNLLRQITRDGSPLDNFTYDSIGRIKTHTDATGLTLTYEYNNLNNITKITYPDGKFVTYTYSGCCPHLVDSVTERSGRTTNYTYDALKRLTQTTDIGGRVTRYVYDDNGNMIQLIDPHGNITAFEYDLDNRLVKKTYADGKSSSFTYDNGGLLDTRKNARGIVSDYVYDENHNLISTTYSDGTPGVTYQYDNFNRVIQRQDGAGAYLYGYDANSRLTSIDGPWVDDTLTYQYDSLGRGTSLAPQEGQTVSYVYDALYRLTDIQIGTDTYTYAYADANPLVQSITRPNTSATTYQYDSLNRLTQISNKDSASAIINQFVYGYDPNKDLRSSETITNGNLITSFQNELITYDYNKVNQLLSSTNPAKSFTYDNDGNMTQGYTPEGYAFTAAYDAENRLKSVEYTDSGGVAHRTEYLYSADAFLAEMKKYENGVLMNDTRFVRDGFLPVQERDAGNNVIREYVWGQNMGGGIGGLLNLNQGGQDYSYLYDGKGNVTALIDASQAVAATYTYDTFGNLMVKTGTLNQLIQFSTKPYDEKTGLSYYGYRFYSPALGRWITRDPLGEAEGINLYGFVGNNPVNAIDPLGLFEYYGCWGGPGWGNCRKQSEDTDFPRRGDPGFNEPVNQRDRCYYEHDTCLRDCGKVRCKKDRQRCRRGCDLALARCIYGLPWWDWLDPILKWEYFIFRNPKSPNNNPGKYRP